MATYQTTYSAAPAKGLPGQIANEEKCNKVSRTVESAAGIAFGQPAFRGSGDHGVILGGTFAATGAGSMAAGNTGAATITAAPAVAAGAKQGRYLLTAVTAGATAAWLFSDPDGTELGEVTTGSAATIAGIGPFTITDSGTDPAIGDQAYIDVTYTANAKFLGLAVLNAAVPPLASGASNPDLYPQYFTGAFMTMGQMYVTAGAAVVDGGDVYWNPATGRYTSTTTHIRIPNATFDTSGGDGDIVEISLKLR
ncbi:hypothetical protein [Phenylobacterium sp.]|uniref:structural cement protein Gp24 n=1 Tax=Phenylobacterium sp. TaxID=1871053 RepID=UPI002726A74A|nr:hypothetical protein [Phenylobacterium sp.]MDO8800056.1 hypothetical protein [Phenylobacterium sp.]